MKKPRTYLELTKELKSMPLDRWIKGMSLQSILQATKFGEISEENKQDVIILKEAFIFLDQRKQRLGVFTRSQEDHNSKIGECTTLLCGNFDRSECNITNDGQIIYNIKHRLHYYIREIAELFNETRSKQIQTVFYHDLQKNKRYLFILFELICDSKEIPLFCRLDKEYCTNDFFIGMRDITDVIRGIHKYNGTPFHVDETLMDHLLHQKHYLMFFPFLNAIFSFTGKFIEIKKVDFTLFKINLIGL